MSLWTIGIFLGGASFGAAAFAWLYLIIKVGRFRDRMISNEEQGEGGFVSFDAIDKVLDSEVVTKMRADAKRLQPLENQLGLLNAGLNALAGDLRVMNPFPKSKRAREGYDACRVFVLDQIRRLLELEMHEAIKKETESTRDQGADLIGRAVDRIDNLIGSLKLNLPAELHVTCMRESLPEISAEFKTAYKLAFGDDPWECGE